MHLGNRDLAVRMAGDGRAPPGGQPEAGMAGFAASFPQRPVTIVVGFPPGGGDVLVRELATYMGADLGQEITLEFGPGAAGAIGAAALASAARDGHTIFLAGRSNIFHRYLCDDVDYDFSIDLTPIALVARMPFVMVAGKNAPLSRLEDVIVSARAASGGYTCAYSETGTPSHVLGGFLRQSVGVRLTRAPYEGIVEALADVIGGRTDLLIFPLPIALPLIRTGNIKALVVMSHQRAPALPEVPTIEEYGLPGADAESWYGLMAPARTPQSVIATLNRSINAALSQPSLQEKLACLAYIPASTLQNTPESLHDLIAQETEKWTAVLIDRNINPLH